MRRPDLIRAIAMFVACFSGSDVVAQVDQIQFDGNASERDHGFDGAKTRISKGGLDESCRQIEPGGSLAFELKCDPRQQNYLTVKLWGSDEQVCTLFLGSEKKRYGRYGESLPELDLCQGGPAFPGRFYYATYPVPQELTTGKRSVPLNILAMGAMTPYAPVHEREQPLKTLSRGIYRAYLDTNPFFAPSADEKQGTAPASKPRKPATTPSGLAKANCEVIDAAIERVITWQLYGPRWEEFVKKGDAPAFLTGALVPGGVPRMAPANSADWVMPRTTGANCQAIKTIGVYAGAFCLEGSKYFRNSELLDRIVRALDFYCVSQGSNGGFTSKTWVGGPKRTAAGDFIEGDGTRWLGRALVEVYADLKQETLDAKIDDDNDPKTTPVQRRVAYARMFARHRDFLASPPAQGRASNQDLFQLLALWLNNEALLLLDPNQAWSREQALALVYRGVGLAPDPYGGRWLTSQGLPLEPWGTLAGGYCGNYGLMCVDLICELAEVTGDEKIQERARQAIKASSHFYYPDFDPNGLPCYRKEGIISARNTKWPAVTDYGIHEYAAAELDSPEALRSFQLWLADGNQPEPLDPDGHFLSATVERIFAGRHLERLLAMPKTDVHLFMEPNQPASAWADAEGQVVAVRDGETRLYVSLNWRRGFRQNQRDATHAWTNNVARIHCTTPTIDRIATISMESSDGFGGLYTCRYGDYWIAMNSSATKTYPIHPPADLGPTVKDLVTGNEWAIDAVPELKARTTFVLSRP